MSNKMRARSADSSLVIQPLDEEARSEYDTGTLFYDVFFKSGDLICLGPPFLNFGTPTGVYCDGEPVRFTCNHFRAFQKPLSILRIKRPLREDRERLNLKFCFPEFEATVSLDALRARPPAQPFRELCLHTLQKDNPGEWIRDWCLWHHRAHRVRRVIIYDNGSRDFPKLDGAFAGLDAGLEVVLVHWPFPYGPRTSLWNKFCQTGALNHFRLFFGGAVRWAVNLDLDEYLYVGAGRSLKELLAQPGRARSPTVYLGSLKFPRPDVRKEGRVRFFDHKMYISDRKTFWASRKYIFQPGRAYHCTPHLVIPKLFSSKLYENRYLWGLLWRYRRLWENLRDGLRYFGMPRRRAEEEESDVLFHHYFGLYTGWKGHGFKKTGADEFPQGALAEHREVRELAAQVGLTETDVPPPQKEGFASAGSDVSSKE